VDEFKASNFRGHTSAVPVNECCKHTYKDVYLYTSDDVGIRACHAEFDVDDPRRGE
jgi:hypothetical protein